MRTRRAVVVVMAMLGALLALPLVPGVPAPAPAARAQEPPEPETTVVPLAPGASAHDLMGRSVAASQDDDNRIYAAGRPGASSEAGFGSGDVLVYLTNPFSGTIEERIRLLPSDPAAGAAFGASVAASADGLVLAVGEPKRDGGGTIRVFERQPDDTFVEVATLLPDDGEDGDDFGAAVDLSADGGRIVGGMPGWNDDTGAVVVFDRQGDGSYAQTHHVTAAGGEPGDRLGDDVAVTADGAAVAGGAPGAGGGTGGGIVRGDYTGDGVVDQMDLAGQAQAVGADGFGDAVDFVGGSHLAVGAPATEGGRGAGYLYEITPEAIVELVQELFPDGLEDDARYGKSVSGLEAAPTARSIAFGAPGHGTYGSTFRYEQTGGSDVFVHTGQTEPPVSSDPVEGAWYGDSVDHGRFDLLAIGAPWDGPFPDGSLTKAGALYVSAGLFSHQKRDGAVDSLSAGDFGCDVAADGDVVAVSSCQEGTVHVYEYDPGTGRHRQRAAVHAPDGADGFGSSVDVDGTWMVVGASASNGSAGEARVYERVTSGEWVERATLAPPDGQAGDAAGSSVAIDDGVAVVGSPNADLPRGRADVFQLVGGTWTHGATLGPDLPAPVSFYGTDVAVGDGLIAIGAPGESFVYVHDAAAPFGPVDKVTGTDTGGADNFGRSVSIAGGVVAVASSVAAYTFGSDGAGGFAQEARVPGIGTTHNVDVVMQVTAALVGADVELYLSHFDADVPGNTTVARSKVPPSGQIDIQVASGIAPAGSQEFGRRIASTVRFGGVTDLVMASLTGDVRLASVPPTGPQPLPFVDLRITKTADPSPVATGGTVTYTITVTNDGNAEAKNVAITDTLGPGQTVQTASAGCVGTGPVTCLVGSIDPGESEQVQIVVTVQTAPGSVTNTATVTSDGDEPTPDPNPNTVEITTDVLPPLFVDVSVDIQADQTEITLGQAATFAVQVDNAADADTAAEDLVLVHEQPGDAVVGVPTAGTYLPLLDTWNVGSLAPGGSETLELTITPPSVGTARVCAHATGHTPIDVDSTPGNFVTGIGAQEDDESCTTIEVVAPDGEPPDGGGDGGGGDGGDDDEVPPPGDGTVTNDPDGTGPTADRPLVFALTSPTGGPVTVLVLDDVADDPASPFRFLPLGLDITAPPATADDPLRLVATIHGPSLPSGPVVVLRNGVPLPGCRSTDPIAPDPCVAGVRRTPAGDLRLDIRTSAASIWTFGVPVDTVQDIGGLCPPSDADGRFDDVPAAGVHARAIGCIARLGIAVGVGPKSFGPSGAVSRGQMASFLVGLLAAAGVDLPAGDDAFGDDDGTTHENAIDRLAAAGVVQGRADGTYGPGDLVDRAQMASFLVAAYELAAGSALPPGGNRFGDDEGSVHAANIDRAAAAGLTTGVAAAEFRPDAPVTRAQLATFLARALARLGGP